MSIFRKKRLYALLFVIILLILFYNSEWLSRWLYPIPYREDIEISAQNYDVDPMLIAAIIRVESNYKPDTLSKKGAVGLMQVMPDTAEWIVTQAGFADLTNEKLERPDVNIEVGAWYIRSLMQQFAKDVQNGNVEDRIAIVAAAYNAGPGSVRKWLNAKTWDGQVVNLQKIPFGETRHYIQRVLYYYKKYVQIYDEKALEGQ
ncbi:lytic transglycosylase domain-containing protein [Paenibacillus turpanensis]|uniref:lytic transglycosylase domain-containing protein n=1 Tax=Paenibacillus turpanensis TaxID=2689078 RepID=UPI001407F2C8|nr:lytic transglycosylase domain-containing protein [Paenibacillus turpanensis]